MYLDKIFDQLVEDIPDKGYSIIDHFFPDHEVEKILLRFQELEEEDAFKRAGIGKLNEFQLKKEIRGDVICWIDPVNANPCLDNLISRMKRLMEFFNRTFYLSLKDFEMHYAIYPTGRFYLKHSDRFQQKPHRIISMVNYFNLNWQPEDGGVLRIHKDTDYVDVEPIAGRTVFFQSELEHEVLPSYRDRYTITGWFLDQPTGLTFL